jgi:hypothetical protein
MVASPPADLTPALTDSATMEMVSTRSGYHLVQLTLGDVAVHGVDDDSDFGSHFVDRNVDNFQRAEACSLYNPAMSMNMSNRVNGDQP